MEQYFTNDMVETGIFLPVVPHIRSLLRCCELRMPPAHLTGDMSEWCSLLCEGDDVVGTKMFLTGIMS